MGNTALYYKQQQLRPWEQTFDSSCLHPRSPASHRKMKTQVSSLKMLIGTRSKLQNVSNQHNNNYQCAGMDTKLLTYHPCWTHKHWLIPRDLLRVWLDPWSCKNKQRMLYTRRHHTCLLTVSVSISQGPEQETFPGCGNHKGRYVIYWGGLQRGGSSFWSEGGGSRLLNLWKSGEGHAFRYRKHKIC